MTRRGFSTIELVIVMVIGGIVAAAIGGVLRRQQRFFVNASAVVEQRVSLRDATGILPGEIRVLSPAGGDVLAFSDSALEMRATVGVAIACDTVAGGSGIDLAPSRADSRTLAAFATTPQPGDIALVYDTAVPTDSGNSGWMSFDVASAASRLDVCATSPFVDPTRAGSAARLALRFVAGSRVPPMVRPGAFVRVLRRVRYRFYRSSASEWFLGYSEWGGTAFGAVQPVSGPYAAYSRLGASGLRLRYFDVTGGEVIEQADAARIARVEIVVRGAASMGMSGVARTFTDSQAITVNVRNR